MTCRGKDFIWGTRTFIMGIINLTPDSFSGDGFTGNTKAALGKAIELEAMGADIIDIGAESTRPGHSVVSIDEELRRLLPALDAILPRVNVPVSIDTYKPEVAKRALDVGASMLNHVWGVLGDAEMLELAALRQIPIVLMHNQLTLSYVDPVNDVISSLKATTDRALKAGIESKNIIIDPGFGFGKTADHNIEIMRRLQEFKTLPYPLLIGTSRKSTIGLILNLPVNERLEGAISTVALSVANGADIVRVHDVQETLRASRVADAIVRNWRPDNWIE
ncbi:dihydropteroate synthase [SAR202 cluster bacterium AC-409-J13_OGT_754m]|nr:dihydropteroate synthase [SAR202 cluster bacterium AC-409-J13_OGT_754m]